MSDRLVKKGHTGAGLPTLQLCKPRDRPRESLDDTLPVEGTVPEGRRQFTLATTGPSHSVPFINWVVQDHLQILLAQIAIK